MMTRHHHHHRIVLLLLVGWSASSVVALGGSWFSSKAAEQPSSDDDDEDLDRGILVSPIVNRELEASVVAQDWPFTVDNIVCEAWAYHHSDWEYMDSFVALLEKEPLLEAAASNTNNSSLLFARAKQLAVEATTKSVTDKSLLEYALSLRAYSPQCEMHRGLARQALLFHQHDFASETHHTLDAFVVSNEGARQGVLHTSVDAFVATCADEQQQTSDENSAETLLPGEVPRKATASDEKNDKGTRRRPSAVVVLYANMTTQTFVEWYKALVDAGIPFVVRHLGHVWYEEVGGSMPTILQGYGVRLDIRNVEYRVFDDRDDEKPAASTSSSTTEGTTTANKAAAMINVTALSTLSKQFLAGVNVSALVGLDVDSALSLQAQLYKIHDAQQMQAQIVPPPWQRRKLSLQAAQAVATTSADVLMTLQDLSQNLPSVASTLVHLEIQDELQELAEQMEGVLSQIGGAALFVNGRSVPIDRPSFNVFEFLNMLKSEQAELENMERRLGPYLTRAALRKVQKAWIRGTDALLADGNTDGNDDQVESTESEDDASVFRIDVGRGGTNAILYVNDIEKDEQYANWPRNVQNMVFAMQYGAPPTVRRNMFTILAVVDPLAGDSENHGISLASQLMQGQFPVRLGVVIVNQGDLDKCAEWAKTTNPLQDLPCPVEDLLQAGKTANMEQMETLEASTHAAHRILAHVIENYSLLAPTYMQYWLQTIDQYKEKRDDMLTLYDLVMIHAQLMNGMRVSSMEEAINEANEVIEKREDVLVERDSPSYGKALRFALNKGIQQGVGFINGRPLPSATRDKSGRKVGEIFMEEQHHIMKLVMDGVITDSSPKSIYAKLLTGDRVFERVHPLLTGDQDDKNAYVTPISGVGSESLLIPEAQKSKETSDAVMLVEAVSDLDSAEGRRFAANFITTMESIPDSLGEKGDVSIAYRILPSTPSSASSSLCKVLSHANSFDAASLLELLSRDDVADMSAEGLLKAIPSKVDPDTRGSILSDINACSSLPYLDHDLPAVPFIVANGRIYSPQDGTLNREDVTLLFDLETGKATAITKLLHADLNFETNAQYDAVAQTAAFLAEQHSKSQKRRSDVEGMVTNMENDLGVESNPLRFSWNELETDNEPLEIKVSAFADPVAEPTQRMVPLLRAVRDHLRLPLSVVLAPQVITDDNIPITSYYRFVAEPETSPDIAPVASFSNLPANHLLTLRMDVPEPWNVQQTSSIQDTDNLRCDVSSGCGDDSSGGLHTDRRDLTCVQYGLKNLLVFGQCYDATSMSTPNGLQLALSRKMVDESASGRVEQVEISPDGSLQGFNSQEGGKGHRYSDTLVMKSVGGYWQLRANPGVWNLRIAPESRGAEIYDIVNGTFKDGKLKITSTADDVSATKTIVMSNFVNRAELLFVKRKAGYEKATLFYEKEDKKAVKEEEEVVNVFSLATGHLYERFLKIMMLSVTKRTSTKVKFWLFENFLSPTFKASAMAMAERIGCDVEFVTYKWPEWLRGQSEKQRIIWGYKILFLDVLFPLHVKKIIYVDADQVVRGDLKELWDMDLHGAPYGYTPMCSSREETLGFQFWNTGFWKTHLAGKPYHISALYVVDLDTFRKKLVGDSLRGIYQQLSADPNSLANLDQDLPNYAQHQIPIFSLPQEWLWCESWCSDETKATAKTIDLCNNPLHKEPKVSMAKRVISGGLFNESWVELDEIVESYDKDYQDSLVE